MNVLWPKTSPTFAILRRDSTSVSFFEPNDQTEPISYAELYVSPVLWPDFNEAELHAAIRSFSTRNRRFGALDATNTLRPPQRA